MTTCFVVVILFLRGIGQNGAEVVHVGAEVEEAKRRFKENNFDTVASEKVPLDRRVKDLRHPDCLNIQYDQGK